MSKNKAEESYSEEEFEDETVGPGGLRSPAPPAGASFKSKKSSSPNVKPRGAEYN